MPFMDNEWSARECELSVPGADEIRTVTAA